MNTENTYNIEEVVEEFMKECGNCDLQYNSEYDKVELKLRTALQSAHAEGVKAGREEERKKIMEIVENWMKTSNPAYAQDLFNLLTPDNT